MRSYCLHCRCAHGAHEEHEDAFTVAAGTPHVGGLWDCPLVYSTSIAPSQRVTAQAPKFRVSEYCTASVHNERRALLRYGCSQLGTSCAKSLMLGIVHTPSSGQPQTKGRMTYQLVQALEPEVPEHQEQHQHHSTHR